MLRRAGLTVEQRQLVQTHVGASMEETKIEEAMFLLFGQDYRRTTNEPSRGFRGIRVPQPELHDGAVAGVIQHTVQSMRQQSRMTMSTTLKRPMRLKRMTSLTMTSLMTQELHGMLMNFTGKKISLGMMLPTMNSMMMPFLMKNTKKCMQRTWMQGEDLLI